MEHCELSLPEYEKVISLGSCSWISRTILTYVVVAIDIYHNPQVDGKHPLLQCLQLGLGYLCILGGRKPPTLLVKLTWAALGAAP